MDGKWCEQKKEVDACGQYLMLEILLACSEQVINGTGSMIRCPCI